MDKGSYAPNVRTIRLLGVIMNQFSRFKILKNIERVCEYKNTGMVSPILAELDMTNLCNHKCPLCVSRHRDSSSLTLEEAVGYIKQLILCGVKAITFTGGGEPLMSKYTIEAIEFSRKNGLQVGLITNGSLLTKNNIPRLLECCEWIRISLDAYSKDSFVKTHGIDGYDTVLKNINTIGQIKKEMNSGCIVGVGYLISEITIDGMEHISRELKETGIDYIQFRPFHSYGTLQKNDSLSKYETNTYKILYSKMKKHDRKYNFCHASNFIIVIQADGNIPICCHFRHNEEKYIGNLKNKTLTEILLGEKKQLVLNNTNAMLCIKNCRYNNHNEIIHTIIEEKIKHEDFL